MSTPANYRPRISLNFTKDSHEPKFPKLKLLSIKYVILLWCPGLLDSIEKIPKIDKSILC